MKSHNYSHDTETSFNQSWFQPANIGMTPYPQTGYVVLRIYGSYGYCYCYGLKTELTTADIVLRKDIKIISTTISYMNASYLSQYRAIFGNSILMKTNGGQSSNGWTIFAHHVLKDGQSTNSSYSSETAIAYLDNNFNLTRTGQGNAGVGAHAAVHTLTSKVNLHLDADGHLYADVDIYVNNTKFTDYVNYDLGLLTNWGTTIVIQPFVYVTQVNGDTTKPDYCIYKVVTN